MGRINLRRGKVVWTGAGWQIVNHNVVQIDVITLGLEYDKFTCTGIVVEEDFVVGGNCRRVHRVDRGEGVMAHSVRVHPDYQIGRHSTSFPRLETDLRPLQRHTLPTDSRQMHGGKSLVMVAQTI